MAVPSSEFTFSISSQSSVAFTPSSSSRDSSNEANSVLTPETPRSIPLFQSLSLNDSTGSLLSTPSRSQNGWLSPGSSPSTYRQQHNASPSPGPEFLSSSHGRQSLRGNHSIFSNSAQANSSVPGAFPVSTNGEESPLSENDASENEENSDSDESSGSDETAEAPTVDIREEPLPAAPVYNHRLQNGLKAVKSELAFLADTMRLSELNQDHSSALHSLSKQAKKMSMFEYPETRTVGFIGDSGVGKSSLINSLLDQKSLSRSSSEGVACTCVVTEFRHIDDNHTGPYTIEADFMTSEEMKNLLEELLTIFRQCHVPQFFQELKSYDEQTKCQDDAKRVWETFQSLFNDQPGLTMEHLSEDYDGAHFSLLAQLERWASAGLVHRPGGLDATEYSVIAGDIEECRDTLDMLTGSNAREGKPALWPFIKLIRVYLKSPILKTGLVLADLPGFSDLNFARVQATERYLSHGCDEVFVVVDIDRACTNPSIQDIMRRCRDDQPRRIICTKSEAISPEEVSRTGDAHARRVKEMNKDIQAVQQKIQSTESRARRASNTRRAEFAVKLFELRMRRLLITRRNLQVSEGLIARHQNVRVFCISNTLYSQYRYSGNNEEEAYVDLAGIRELRRYCQLVPSEALMRSTSEFLNHQVPALLLSLRQWALSGSDSVTGGNASILRQVLENAQDDFQRELISNQGLAHILRQRLVRLYDEYITSMIRRSQTHWTTASIGISREWAGWAHGTYTAFCRRFGEHATAAVPNGRCWNNELLLPAQDQLIHNWDNIQNWLQMQEATFANNSFNVFSRCRGAIDAHIHLAPRALQNLQRSMDLRKKCVEDHVMNSLQKIKQISQYEFPTMGYRKHYSDLVYRNTKRDMAYGHASSYISGLMQPAYARTNQEGGTGSDRRRKNIMNDHLTHSMLFANLSNVAGREYIEALDKCFNELQRKVTEEVECLVRDLNAVIAVEGRLSEAEKATTVAEALRCRFQATEDILERAQTIVRELNPEP
ncbi:uncharacterized protein N7484_004661 [Penicillium longicatenatum]|uniref:uncharacterized protein n=1 Tax=Penicillium longicatenatum TaxID=1561947 RepID=UPI002546C895|nr:uncharacterized protein N7484_004661 [Penicillium longicatenatum]KAJ5650938.1 hypothetical protein N7484_004661 [Penicillium longicatenatum]